MPASQQDRKLVEVYNMTGGLNTAGDPSNMAPNEWRDCQNMMVARQAVGTGSTFPSYDFTCVTHPPITNKTSSTSVTGSSFLYGQPHKTWTLATGQNSVWPSESWTAGGTGAQTYQNTFSNYGNQCVQQVNTAGQNTTSTITISAIDITGPVGPPRLGNMTALVLDVNITNHSNFSSGYIRVGSDSSNYYQFNMSAPSADGNQILFFTWASPSSTTGTPNNASITYIQISTTASGGGSFTLQFNNLRWAAFSNSTTLVNASGNIRDIFVYDQKADGTSPLLVAVCGDSVFLSNGFFDNANTNTPSWYQIMSKFTNWSPQKSTVNNYLTHSSRFNFSQMPDYKNTNPNNMVFYFVNGVDGYFSFNFNASAGSMFSRISANTYKYIQNFKNYMMLAGRGDKPNELDWSDLNDPSNLSTNASGNLTFPQIESGQVLTGILPFDDYMFCFRMGDVWILSGNSNNDFAIKKTKSRVGAIDQKYITKAGMQVYFAHFGGIYSLNWWDESNLISRKVGDLLNKSSIGLNGLFSGFLIYNPLREILIYSCPSDNSNDPVTAFATSYRLTFSIPQASYGGNIQGGSWGKLGLNSTSDSLAFCALYYGGSNLTISSSSKTPVFMEAGVSLYQWDPSAPDSVSMTYMLRTAWHAGGHPKIMKNVDKFGFWNRTQSSLSAPTNPTIQYFTGFSDTAAQTVSTGTTPVAGYTETLLTPNSTQAISASISTTGTNQTTNAFQVSGYSYVWTQDGVI